VGIPFTEGKLFAVGTAFQQATNWHKQRPPT
jgi:Asp-tRNA(Asn)/Glu-tRNA(Gln) amidotransferase A subunit family amidase